MDEQAIIDYAYNLSEQDSEGWETDSSEYETARGILNIGIRHWENYESTTWVELFATLTDNTQISPALIKTLTAGTYSYNCPTNMKRPASYVRTVHGSVSTYWTVIPVSHVAGYANSEKNFCYFTGNLRDGFKLHFNPNVTLTTGDTIKYEYYVQATPTADPADVVELSNPIFLSYWIAAHIADGGIDSDLFAIAEAMLEEMRTTNMSGLSLVADNVPTSPEENVGFGY